MDTTITARHCEISEALRERAESVAERLGTFARRPMEMAVVFDSDGPLQVVEIRLHVAAGEVFVAKADGPDHRSALDRAEEKLRRQVEKAAGRSHRAKPDERPSPAS